MVDMYKMFWKIIRDRFVKVLERKTGWGRNEILREFDKLVASVFAETLDQISKKDIDNEAE